MGGCPGWMQQVKKLFCRQCGISLQVRDIAVQYIELVPTEAPYKSWNWFSYITGSLAIDFDSLLTGTAGSAVFTVNLRKLSPGTYAYARVGIAYLSYDIPPEYPACQALNIDRSAGNFCFISRIQYITSEVQINQ